MNLQFVHSAPIPQSSISQRQFAFFHTMKDLMSVILRIDGCSGFKCQKMDAKRGFHKPFVCFSPFKRAKEGLSAFLFGKAVAVNRAARDFGS